MRVVPYLRVSTGKQLDGYGLDVQEQACRAYAERLGWTIIHIAVDPAVSGMLPAHERPGLTEALALVGCGGDGERCADVLLAARLDRIARELTVQEAILGQVWGVGGQVHMADSGEVKQDDPDDPMRTALRQVAGIFAQLDRALINKRLRDGRRAKAAAGGKGSGSYPYGWDKQGEVPAEQSTLERLRDCAERGLTLAATAEELNGCGLLTRTGRPWTIGTVHNVLKRERIESPVP